MRGNQNVVDLLRKNDVKRRCMTNDWNHSKLNGAMPHSMIDMSKSYTDLTATLMNYSRSSHSDLAFLRAGRCEAKESTQVRNDVKLSHWSASREKEISTKGAESSIAQKLPHLKLPKWRETTVINRIRICNWWWTSCRIEIATEGLQWPNNTLLRPSDYCSAYNMSRWGTMMTHTENTTNLEPTKLCLEQSWSWYRFNHHYNGTWRATNVAATPLRTLRERNAINLLLAWWGSMDDYSKWHWRYCTWRKGETNNADDLLCWRRLRA